MVSHEPVYRSCVQDQDYAAQSTAHGYELASDGACLSTCIRQGEGLILCLAMQDCDYAFVLDHPKMRLPDTNKDIDNSPLKVGRLSPHLPACAVLAVHVKPSGRDGPIAPYAACSAP